LLYTNFITELRKISTEVQKEHCASVAEVIHTSLEGLAENTTNVLHIELYVTSNVCHLAVI